MNLKKITEELTAQYPGKKILSFPEKNPTSVRVEVESAEAHPEYSIAVSVIDKTDSHLHHKTAQIYQVLKGTLTLVKNGRSSVLKEGEVDIIKPGEIHYATGAQTWVRIYSEPGLVEQDHIAMSGERARPVLSFRQERLLVEDFAKCLEFYTSVLGFEAGFTDKEHGYAELKTGDTLVALFDRKNMVEALNVSVESLRPGSSGMLVFSVEDLERAFNYITGEKKVPPVKGITEYAAWGLKAFHILDPNGTLVEINQEISR